MIIHTITLNSLAKIVPDEVAKFKEICKNNKISVKGAIRDLYEGDSELDPVSLEAIRTVFNRMSDAFRDKTRYMKDHTYYTLKLEPIYNDEELEGAGSLIRVYGSVIMSPAAEGVEKLIKKRDITVHKTAKAWKEEKLDTGI